eukprot:GHRQ01039525.1.p1 GENE.GHRQ01039525.1~~GHRQ01039525.1.p1  ORF type:complete len:126 (-),score=22.50 GHRQ01039525.1:69-446(-)
MCSHCGEISSVTACYTLRAQQPATRAIGKVALRTASTGSQAAALALYNQLGVLHAFTARRTCHVWLPPLHVLHVEQPQVIQAATPVPPAAIYHEAGTANVAANAVVAAARRPARLVARLQQRAAG